MTASTAQTGPDWAADGDSRRVILVKMTLEEQQNGSSMAAALNAGAGLKDLAAQRMMLEYAQRMSQVRKVGGLRRISGMPGAAGGKNQPNLSEIFTVPGSLAAAEDRQGMLHLAAPRAPDSPAEIGSMPQYPVGAGGGYS